MTATAEPLVQTPPPMARAIPRGYFEQPLPAAIILGSFFAVALPMAAIELLAPNALVTWVYVWLFGITHFVISLTIYCNRANLTYFASSWKTAAVFFMVPVLIFVAFDLIHAFRLRAEWPLLALVFFGAVRFFDFFHLNRQTFGVLQMFKGRTKAKFSLTVRRLENNYLIAFVFVLMITFLSGGVCPLIQEGGPLSLLNLGTILDMPRTFNLAILQAAWLATSLICITLFAMIVRAHRAMAKANPQSRGFGPALAYLILQSFGAAMAALYLPLYLATLAIHYVEYHVLMVPRCFHCPLDQRSRIDRVYGWLRERPVLFCVVVLSLAALVTRGAMVGMNAAMGAPILDLTTPVSYLVLIALFDGIFVFHYFVEMFIWKFSDPHFRKMLAGLYFTPAAKPS